MDQALSPETLNRRKRRTALAAGGALLILAGAAWGLNRLIDPNITASELTLAQVRTGSIANTINATGIVIAMHEEQVTSPIPTRVVSTHAKPGQTVAAGDLLLSLDDHTLALAVEGLKEQLAQQENKIEGLTLDLDQKRKQILASMELLALDLRTAEVKWARYKDFKDTGTIAKNDLLTAELNVQRFEIQLRQQRESLEDVQRSTQSNIQAARLQKSILQKQLEQQMKLLAQAQVRAPFAGVLTWMVTDEGANVTAGQLLAKVSEMNNFGVEVSVSDFHARALSVGQAVRVAQGGQTLDGELHTVFPEIQNGTVKLWVALAQPHHPMLRHKLRVEAHIVTDQKANTLLIDTGPAITGPGTQSLFVVKDGLATKLPIALGASDGKQIEILGGAQNGDQIVTSELRRFKDLSSFRVTP